MIPCVDLVVERWVTSASALELLSGIAPIWSSGKPVIISGWYIFWFFFLFVTSIIPKRAYQKMGIIEEKEEARILDK